MKNCCRFVSGKCSHKTNPQPLENFCVDRKRKDGLSPRCKSCFKEIRERTKEQRSVAILAWRKRNPDKMIQYRANSSEKNVERMRKWREKNILQKRYGISREDWNNIYADQNGCCKICEKHSSELKKTLQVDHCHAKGHVRALLCTSCNLVLGHLKDKPELAYKLAKYLELHNGLLQPECS